MVRPGWLLALAVQPSAFGSDDFANALAVAFLAVGVDAVALILIPLTFGTDLTGESHAKDRADEPVAMAS